MQQHPKRHILSWSELRLAVFLSVVIALATFTIYFSGAVSELFQQKVKLKILIDEVGGLRLGAPVWVQGVTVGTVTGMEFVSKGIEIRISIGREYLPVIYKNASAEVKAVGLLGSKYVEIFRGKKESGPVSVNQVIKGELIDPLKNIDKNFSVTIKKLTSMMENITNGSGTIGELVNDTTLASDVKSTVSNVNKLIEEIRKNPKKFIKIELF
jgi:phospholipid/cholesterol/gamma-HCH transport system substrate-binding protein